MFNLTIENLEALLPTQRDVNRKINEKLDKKPAANNYILAFNIELYEFFNAVGTWKWWKHNHEVNKERVLDELADCYAFFLSAVLTVPTEIKEDEDNIQYPRRNLLSNFVNVYIKMLDTINEANGTVNDLIMLVGTSSELTGDNHIGFFTAFSAANAIAGLLWPDLTWEDVMSAYMKKSGVNVDRQNENY